MYMYIFSMSDAELPFSVMCLHCWFSTRHFYSVHLHMQSEAHHARCGCCNAVFNHAEALEQHLFHEAISAFDRQHISIFELMQASLLFNYNQRDWYVIAI